jgi:prefoldin subunit 5
VVAGGIFESKIKCRGDVKAIHVHKSEIDAGGDLVVEKEIIDSKVELYGACKIEYGTIISSEIAARDGIITQNAGTAMSKPAYLDVGVDHKLRREISGLKKLFSKAGRKKKEITPQIEALKAQSDQINGELGEVAQKQDRYMVQLRDLQAKFKDQQNVDEPMNAEYEKTVAELEARRSAIDAVVEELMKRDSEIETTIAELEEQETEVREEQTELEERIEKLRQKREAEKGKPVVKVSGDLFAGTQIAGPRSTITIDEDCHHVNIFETDKTDDGEFARWHMKIGPLR